jgi:hypothetical protein
MDRVLLVHPDAVVQHNWAVALARGAEVVVLDSIGALPRLLARGDITLIVAEADSPVLKVLRALALFLTVPPVAVIARAA